ncbi:kinase-like domain-containing protein [Mycena galopus ATCC 62051]|nr:kinase-like domain-containing protein [Mycena galopus ATCC 62051]
MASEGAVNAVVESLDCRRRLLELSTKLELSNDPKFRAALRTDDKRIATLLLSIFSSQADEEAILRLEGDSAQYFLDVVQNTLDQGFLLEHGDRARRIIRKLSKACDKLPSSLFITGVTGREENCSFGGGYGDVYRAIHGNRSVALKRLRHFLRGSELRRMRLNFCREALLWRDLQHPHILPFLGIDRESFPEPYFCMVSPWMEHGTVMNYLKTYGLANVDKLLYEIAQGLQYLHSRNIVHGDLRGKCKLFTNPINSQANILVNEDWSACLADFGLSSFSNSSSSTSARGGSLYWMAPELFDPDRLDFTRTPATDVYAFGCVCLELYTGLHPFSDLSETAALFKVIDGERPERPSWPAMSDVLWEHITQFWAQDPTVRPVTEIVVQKSFLHVCGVERMGSLDDSVDAHAQAGYREASYRDYNSDEDEGVDPGERPQPSAKALGKRKEMDPYDLGQPLDDESSLGHKDHLDDRPLDSDDENDHTTPARFWMWHQLPAPHFVYDAAAERTQARIRQGHVSALIMNGVY